LGLAAITYDNQKTLKEFSQRFEIGYPLMADPGSIVIRRFRMLDPDNTGNNIPPYGMKDAPYPGYFVVDPKGVVRERFVEAVFSDRFTANNVIGRMFPELMETASGPKPAPHMNLFLGQSDQRAAPGSRVTLIIDGVLPSGMHVYAPSVKGYKPIELVLKTSSEFSARPAEYPRAEIMHLNVIREDVPVYKGRFRISQDIVFASYTTDMDFELSLGIGRSSSRQIPVSGVLRYQACDDKICYPPTEVPVSWNVEVHQVDRQRASPENQRHE
jgi:hypothetical protein